MRKIVDTQMKLGEVDIADIRFDLRSRDEIPKLLMGLQSIYCNPDIRQQVFEVLTSIIPKNVDPNNGRRGMDLWRILVLGTLRLCCNWDYDKLHDIANNHDKLRKMLGHSEMDKDYQYALQTLKDNVSLLTPEVLDRINQIVVKYGQQILGKKPKEDLRGSCDSFVVETDVHYPTDINLLFDAARKMIALIMGLCGQLDIRGWRQGKNNIRKVKRFYRKAQQLKRSTSKDPKKKAQRDQLIISAHLAYVDLVQSLIHKAKDTINQIQSFDIMVHLKIEEIQKYIAHVERQIDQISRRVVEGETIPHHEKIFSIFEEHTEWISKGKAGVPVELGLKVCIVKDQFGFILHHHVMQKETDDKIAVSMVRETQNRFAEFNGCTFDKGFHSPENQRELATIIDEVILPRKGKLSAINQEIEHSKEFIEAKRKHSAIESSINALENHGLDRCRDHGIHGFKQYVALAVVARNIQIVGHILQQKELKRKRRLKTSQEKKLLLAA
jgi:IS5 family transposase